MTDLTAASVKSLGKHGDADQMVGRVHDVWGTREVGLYRVTLTASAPAGGFTFDPHTYGFQGVIGTVIIVKHSIVANFASTGRYQFQYDYVNGKIVPLDATDSYDDATGDDLSTIQLDLIVVGE